MKKILIITTINDLSIALFLTQRIQKIITVDFCFFHEHKDEIEEKIQSSEYDFIYIRDPFTYAYNEADITDKINMILKNRKDAYFVDKIESTDDVFFEDKYIQYTLFSAFMPSTKILQSVGELNNQDFIVKKRISSRGKGIIFDPKDLFNQDLSEYIIQKRIQIDKEYRVYVLFHKIITLAAVKSSKTETKKIKVIDSEEISLHLRQFVENIIKDNTFDFIGLDIGISNGKPYLIEINRSCLFNEYFSMTGVNLAEDFIEELVEYD